MTLILTVIIVALVFEYINGFHDTANSIATVVSTKVLTPRQAVFMAAVTNLIGALWGTAVAKTISSGLVDGKVVTSQVLICALLGAIIWNLVTWWFGLPSSSSHALVGGLCGGALAASQNNWNVIIWSLPAASGHWWEGKGILWKVIVPMLVSPVLGLLVGFLIMGVLYFLLRNWRPQTVNKTFGKLQLVSSAGMGFMHGTNDAQKTMGILFLALVAGTSSGTFDSPDGQWSFFSAPEPAGSVAAAHLELGRLDQQAGKLASAARHFEKATANPTGKYLFAQALQKGEGIAAKPELAATLLQELADAKFDASAIKSADFIAKKQKDLPATPEAAATWLKTNAAKGNADSLVALGVRHLKAHGVPPDPASARDLFERAVKLNHPAACYNLGLMHLTGVGVAKDEKLATDHFKNCIHQEAIPTWIKITCAIVMAAGTAAGGWRIIKTLGHKMVKLQPVHGFAAETTGAAVIAVASHWGIPVSTTHIISSAIMGVGAAKRLNAIRWNVVERILWAWVFTIPVSALLAYLLFRLVAATGHAG